LQDDVFQRFNCAVYVCTWICVRTHALPYVCMHGTHVYVCVYVSNFIFPLHATLHFEQRIGFEISGQRGAQENTLGLFHAEKRGDAIS